MRVNRRRSGESVAHLVLALPSILLLTVLALYPMVILVQMSLSEVTASNLRGAWGFNGLANFVAIFQDPDFRQVLAQTLVLVLGVMIVSLGAGFIVAMLLRHSTRLGFVTQTIMLLVWALPPVVVGSLWKFFFASAGPLNQMLITIGLLDDPIPFLAQPSTSLLGIAAVTLWVGIPFATLVLKSAVLDIPLEIWEAARMDGASTLALVLQIVLPMIRPTLYVLGVLSVVGTFKGFDFIYVMTVGGPGVSSSTVPFLGYRTAFENYEFGLAGAISVVAMIMVLALAVAYILALKREER